MLILITDKCNLSCKHCMQNASPKNNSIMDMNLFGKTMNMAKKLGARVINIAGGEPTTVTCGMLNNFLSIPLFMGFLTTLESNGSFLEDEEKITVLENIAELYPDKFLIQITAFKEYYTNRDKVLELFNSDRTKRLKKLMGDRLSIADEKTSSISLIALGRSASGDMLEKAKEHNRFPSCINSALMARQINFNGHPCRVFEDNFRFCLPMVDPHGGVHLGESIFCKEICNITDGIDRILQEIQDYKPCGKCANYHLHFDNPTTDKEKKVYELIK